MTTATRTKVLSSGLGQQVTIPAEFHFNTDEVYVSCDPLSGTLTLSEKPPRPSMAEIFRMLDEAGAAELVFERDLSLPEDKELF